MTMYKVTKCNIKTDACADCGIWTLEDMKLIVRGYHNNGLFYEKKNSNTIYIVDEVEG